uniref:U2A'/phosphoprotein 32 family A C-terminal domain-containing protein n=1 Tax=Globisporangium ultimum (strain ATCC 200006 / CBS 805.95 / DAOM BR144) TaxID=431595 RepID=K3WE74_GLOUD
MAAHGDDTTKAANGSSSGAGIVADGKRKIKKLTADKIRENLQQITKKNGEVDLTGHGIESIISLDGLQNTTKLNLSHNKITKLSDMKRVQNITMLKLIDNKLNGEHLKKLVILNVAENQVARIPSEVLRNLRTLKALVLNNNSITTLEWIPKFPELNSLIVSNNRISQFPARTMDHLPALTKISMSHNLLEEIPDFSVLSELTELRLSHNKIKKIPFSLTKLKNLRVLELGHNEIDDWEGIEALSRLENLKQLNLSGNPIIGQPLEVMKKGAKHQEKKKAADEDDDDESSSSSSDEEEEKLTAEEKMQRKETKRLDAKHKQYNFKMKRLFPKLVIRDGQRVLDKRTHGYIAPPKEEKKPKRKHEDREQKKTKKDKKDKKDEKNEKDEASERKEKKKRKTDKSSSDTAESAEKKSEKPVETAPQKPAKAAKDVKKQVDVVMEPAAAASTPVVADTSSASVDKPKKDDKKKKPSKDDKQKKHQSKDSASGVVAVKQFNKSKKAKKERQALDLRKLDFAPNVGMGGSSAWD